MFKKTEESEWTRFSRALGGAPQTAPPAREDDPSEARGNLADDEVYAPNESDEPPTLSQSPPVEPEVYQASAPAPAPAEQEAAAYHPKPPTVAAQALPTPLGRAQSLEQDETVLGEGASIEGSIRSERSIRVRGAVQGEIESKQRVLVEEPARVEARITAEQVTVLGQVNGSIVCTGRVEIASSARVTGEVVAGTLIIQEGAFFEGNLKMSNGRASESV